MKSSIEELYIGNIPYDAKESEFKTIFSEFGKVDNLDWKTKDGRFRGYCYVTFTTDEEKDKALAALNSKEIKGRQLSCQIAPPQEEKVNPPSTTLYVGNLPASVTEEELKEKISKIGPVVGIRLVYARNGEFKKCAFLDFSDQETATKVFESQVSLQDQELVINYNAHKDPRTESSPNANTFRGRGKDRGARGAGHKSGRGGGFKSERGGGFKSERGGRGRGGSRGGRGGSRGGSFRGGRGSRRGGK